MSYVSRNGRRPNEYASKSSHTNIVKDPVVSKFLDGCNTPKKSNEIDLTESLVEPFEELKSNPVNHIIAIDGGYTSVVVKREFPSSTLSFFQFGTLIFSINDLETVTAKPFIAPEDMAKLKEIERYKLAVPTKNIILSDSDSLIDSVRKSLFNFFNEEPKDSKFIETLKWFFFEEYGQNIQTWVVHTCPNCETSDVLLKKSDMRANYTFECPNCHKDIYLTDFFKLHEIIDNEIGAEGILSYLNSLLEQTALIHLIKVILQTKASLMEEILFIKDGPLAFFGQTAHMRTPMRNLLNYLFAKGKVYLAGLEKSGAFVEHADEIANKLKPGSILFLSNDYIHKYIIPSKADPNIPYGSTTYYGSKIIYKADDERIYVITIPTKKPLLNPTKNDFPNIDVILTNIKKLKCDMYDSALIPITLVNKLVSLANHPSSIILEKFARDHIS